MKKKIFIGTAVVLVLLAAAAAGLYFGGFLPPMVKLKSDQVEADRNIDPMDLVDVSKHRDIYEVSYVESEDEDEPDYSVLGKYSVSYNVTLRDRVIRSYDFEINVIDTTAPVISCEDTIRIAQGSKVDISRYAKASDNAQGKTVITLEGEYDVKKTGSYDVTVVAVDESGNRAEKKIALVVAESEEAATSTALTNSERALIGYWANKSKDMLIQIANDGSNSKTRMKIVFSYLSDSAAGADAGGKISYIEPVGTNQYKLVYTDYTTKKKETLTVSLSGSRMQVKSSYNTVTGSYARWSSKQVKKYRK